MTEIWKPKDRDTLQHWVDTIVAEASDKLNSWEIGFIENMQLHLASGGGLSQKQEESLERIYAEKTP